MGPDNPSLDAHWRNLVLDRIRSIDKTLDDLKDKISILETNSAVSKSVSDQKSEELVRLKEELKELKTLLRDLERQLEEPNKSVEERIKILEDWITSTSAKLMIFGSVFSGVLAVALSVLSSYISRSLEGK